MNDDRLRQALRSLPRAQARPGFTGQVLRRLEEERSGFLPPRWAWAAAAAVLVLALAFGWRDWQHRQQRSATLAQLEALLLEKRQLEAELVALQQLTADARPVVYLGGNERVDLVLDLARFHSRGGFRSDPVVPADRLPAGWPLESQRPELPRPDVLRTNSLRPPDLEPGEHAKPLRVVY